MFKVILFSLNAFSSQFTSEEVEQHRQNIEIITQTAAQCLEATWADHVDFFNKHGISKYYGERRKDYAKVEQRKAVLRRLGKPEKLAYEMQGTSCVGLAAKCLGQGFKAAGMTDTWNKIYPKLVASGMLGTELQKMLQELGWKVVYWNPDPDQNRAWDEEDRRLNPLPFGRKWNSVWGGHEARYQTVVARSNYFGIQVDDSHTLVGFKTEVPASFKKVPFFIGTAHAGYHVFPGFFGKVIEAHSMRNLNAMDNMEVSPFNPLATGGGPRWTRSEKYRSGILVVPPSVQ